LVAVAVLSAGDRLVACALVLSLRLIRSGLGEDDARARGTSGALHPASLGASLRCSLRVEAGRSTGCIEILVAESKKAIAFLAIAFLVGNA